VAIATAETGGWLAGEHAYLAGQPLCFHERKSEMTKSKLPATTTAAKSDHVLALPNTSATISETIALLTADLQRAVADMAADDVSFEVNASRGELHLRLRAYRHRRENGGIR
jgi:hypothetical protein